MSSGTMREYHPAPEVLERFVYGTLGPLECRNVVRHLLTGCPVCRQVTGRFWAVTEKARLGKFLCQEASPSGIVD